jgi:hypothetical protein
MRRRLIGIAITLGLALGAPALGVIAGTAPLACAATDQRAALVVDTGGEARSYCVALGAASVSGTDLIRLAHEQYGLDYRLGFGGRAVCRLANVGVDGGDCFGAYPDFWGYWHGDGSGGWSWASGSAAEWTVDAGDVEGWRWGPGQDGATHAAPPATRETDVCPRQEPSPEPSPEPNQGGGGRGHGAQPSPSPTPSPSGDRRPNDRGGDGADDRHTATPTPTGTPTPSSTGAPPVVLAGGPGPPTTPSEGGATGPVAAVAAVLVLGAAGAVLVRRRRAV